MTYKDDKSLDEWREANKPKLPWKPSPKSEAADVPEEIAAEKEVTSVTAPPNAGGGYKDRPKKKKRMTDEELLDCVRRVAEELGRPPKRLEVPENLQLKTRFGPWPRILEMAGVKEPTQARLEKLERRKEKRVKQRERRREWKAKQRTIREAAEASSAGSENSAGSVKDESGSQK